MSAKFLTHALDTITFLLITMAVGFVVCYSLNLIQDCPVGMLTC